jgi:hypothetical protein
MSETTAPRCNAEITKLDGTKDHCIRPEGHNTSHLGALQRAANTAKRNEASKAFTAWKHDNDPTYAAKQAEARAKKVAKLEALAAELGYKVTAPKA